MFFSTFFWGTQWTRTQWQTTPIPDLKSKAPKTTAHTPTSWNPISLINVLFPFSAHLFLYPYLARCINLVCTYIELNYPRILCESDKYKTKWNKFIYIYIYIYITSWPHHKKVDSNHIVRNTITSHLFMWV